MLYLSTVAVFLFISVINGYEPRTTGIRNGFKAKEQEFPHHAYIGVNRLNGAIEWKCNGAIISEYYVATTLSCLSGFFDITIRVGSNNHPTMKQPAGFLELKNKKGTRPLSPPSDPNVLYQHDVALIETNKKISYTRAIQPVKLQKFDHSTIAANVELVATGFGSQNVNPLWKLQYLTLTVISRQECAFVISKSTRTLEEEYVCAVGMDRSRKRGSLCEEWGAPFVLKEDKSTLVGFYERSEQNCDEGGPEAFLNLMPYVSWIKKQISRRS